jgi:hypothetical protein
MRKVIIWLKPELQISQFQARLLELLDFHCFEQVGDDESENAPTDADFCCVYANGLKRYFTVPDEATQGVEAIVEFGDESTATF